MPKTRRLLALLTATTSILALAVGGPAAAASADLPPDEYILVEGLDASILSAAKPTDPRAAAIPNPVRGDVYVGQVKGVDVIFNTAWQWLDKGKNWYFGNARLAMQTDGNLVVYNRHNGDVKWESNTDNYRASQMLFQDDSNLVLYTPGYTDSVWATDKHCRRNVEVPLLALQADSNLVIYCASEDQAGRLRIRALWSTGAF
ncbi:MAG TPA: hypothetical protein VES42_10730 [Pilimelia sp.]|nr:hypothetical protein [Pilimelia sp.]